MKFIRFFLMITVFSVFADTKKESTYESEKRAYLNRPKVSAKEKKGYINRMHEFMPKLWTNDYSNLYIFIEHHDMSELDHTRYVCATMRKGGETCKMSFDKVSGGNLISVYNTQYSKLSEKYYFPSKHVSLEQAEKRAEAVSNIFGVSNIWDKASYTVQLAELVYGVWTFYLTANINGYPSLYGVSCAVADDPDMNIYRWGTTIHEIPSDLGTNVVLNSTAARKKGTEYINKYFFSGDVEKGPVNFITNHVEYITPNYNFIREDGLDEFYDGGHTNRPALTWVNYFKRNYGSKYDRHFPILIYVDAETGEMLGGTN